MKAKWRAAAEHAYMLCVSAFLLWNVAYMTEAQWTFAAPQAFPYVIPVLAGAALCLCRFRLGAAYLGVAFALWTFISGATYGGWVMAAGQKHVLNALLAFAVMLPAPRVVAEKRLMAWLRGVLAAWTACFALQAAIGLWAAFSGHAVFSLRGTWYIGVNLGDHRLYLMAYVTTAATKMGLSALLAVLGACRARSRAGRAAYGAAAALMLLCLSLTDCRTAFLAVGGAVGVVPAAWVMRRSRRDDPMRRRLLCFLGGGAACAASAVGAYLLLSLCTTILSPLAATELTNINLLELPGALLPAASAEAQAVQHRALEAGNLFNGRPLIWHASVSFLLKHPAYLLRGTTPSLSQSLTNLYLSVAVDRPFVHAHSIYLQTLVEWGLPGFGLLAAMLAAFGVSAWRVLVRLELPWQQRLLPLPVIYVLLCETVDCFTRLTEMSPLLLFACLFAGLTAAAERREGGRA